MTDADGLADYCMADMQMQDDQQCVKNLRELCAFVRAVCVRGGNGHWTHGVATEQLGVTQADIDGWIAAADAERERRFPS